MRKNVTCFWTLPVLITGFLGFALPAYAQLPLGSVSNVAQTGCKGLSGTCYTATVSAPGVANLSMEFKIIPPAGSPTAGIVLLTPGLGAPDAYENDATYAPYLIDGLTAENFEVIEIWCPGLGPPGYYTGPAGPLATGGARWATLADYLFHNYASARPFCALGSSGGAASVAYALSQYGLGKELTFAEPISGPVFTRIDYSCQGNGPFLSCQNSSLNWGFGVTAVEGFVDASFSDSNCLTATYTGTTQYQSEFFGASIDNGNEATSFDTIVKVLSGGLDLGVGPLAGLNWLSGITSTTYSGCVPDAGHEMLDVQDTANQILSDMQTYCVMAVPAVSLAPTSINFGSQQLGTGSSVQNVTLTNTGTAVVTISSITVGGSNSTDFGQTNTCGTSVGAGSNCTISVTFTPTAAGSRSATIIISDDATGSPQTVALSGVGTSSQVSLTPGSLSFGNEYVGSTSAPQTVTLNNTGSATLNIFSVTTGADYAQTNNCGSAVPSGSSCSFTVIFTPTAAGPLNESLSIADNATGSPQSVPLMGTGVALVPQVTISPASLTFGTQVPGTTSPSQPVTLINTGNAPLVITSAAPSGDFALATTSSSCPYAGGMINPGSNCTIDITFTPTEPGVRTGAITVTDNAMGSPQAIGLTGTGATGLTSPVPFINVPVVPGAAAPGSPGLTLTVTGAAFAPGAAVEWNGSPLLTNPVSQEQLTATVPAADVAVAETASITVVNPAPGGGASNVVFFPVTVPTSSVWFGRADSGTGNGPQWVGTADFNLDGKPDLAVANNIDGTVSILLGNGDGTFASQPAIAVGSGPVFGAIGDLNGDGIPDLAVADFGSNAVSVLLGTGGAFGAPITVANGNTPVALALADFNLDGNLDLAVANVDNTVSILLGNGDGTFSTSLPPINVGNGPASMIAADLNGDGLIDLAVANGVDGTISLLFGNGDGTFTVQPVITLAPGLTSLAAADLNGDGVLDLVAANTVANSVSILLGAGGGAFNAGAVVATGNAPSAVAIADWNGDGISDLAVSNAADNTVELFLGNGDGTFQAGSTFSTGTDPVSLASADFNNDGRMDVAAVDLGSNSVAVLVQAPQVNLSPTSLTFGNQQTGTSSTAQNVNLSNAGTAALTISTIAVTGTNSGDFTQSNNCGSSVAANTSCGINVTFTPLASGTRTAAITVTDNAGGSPQSVTLSGTGTAPAVTLSPLSLSFGNQQVGTSSAVQSAMLTNSGTAVLAITSLTITGSNGSDFSQSNNCGTNVAAGANCTISVTFTPMATGSRSAGVTITDNAAGSPQSVSLAGTGTAPTAGVSPPSLAFGNQLVGTSSASQNATLTNSGSAPLTISSITVTGANSGDFTQTNNCGSSVAAGANCTIVTTFTPAAAGSRSALLTISDNATGSPQTVALSGTGTAPAALLAPGTLTFGSQQVGTTSTAQNTTLTNTGTAPLSITGVAIGGSNPADFGQTNTCPISPSTLGAGLSCVISVTFGPTAAGSRSASLIVTDQASGSPQSASLSGTGLQAAVSLSPTSLTFGNQAVGTKSSGRLVTLTNTGTATLTINSIMVTGANAGDFTETNTCGGGGGVGRKCTITVTFAPTATDMRSANLTISDNAPGSPQTVSLTGTGTAPAVTLSPTSLTFGVQKIGTSSATQKTTLTNSGTSALTITGIAITGSNSGDFTQTNTCPISPSTLGASKTCSITVTFKPTAGGTRSASLSVTDNATGSPQTVALTGTGTAVQISPTSLSFGSIKVGKTSSSKIITLTNLGSTTLSISSVAITGANGGDFNQTNTCGSGVGGGQSCTISVTLTPLATGSRSASISVTDSGGGSPQTVG